VDEETPLSSPPLGGLSLSKENDEAETQLNSSQDSLDDVGAKVLETGDTDEEEDDAPVVSTARRRGRVTVFDDSDDE
jgi:hypothetical protein